MNNATYSTHHLNADGEHNIPIYLWEPPHEPTAVIQIFHGLGEHAARYRRFAEAAAADGYAVCAHDHRGHGPEAEQLGFYAPKNGWDLLVADGRQVFEFLRARFAGKPIVLLGHSMGSFIAQCYAMQFSQDLTALVLSGSTSPSRIELFPGRLLARFESWRRGPREVSPLLDKLGFAKFNKQFEPSRTDFDWLSRDTREVDIYVEDPLCGGPNSAGLWVDLLGGLFAVARKKSLHRISADLPILITGGGDDPVGGERGMRQLAANYEATGHGNLSTRIYAGGRHEMLNETSRDEFTNDLLSWIAQQLIRHQA